MKYDNKNFILAIVLSMAIIFGWQYFYAKPQADRLAEQAGRRSRQQAATCNPHCAVVRRARRPGAGNCRYTA